MISKAFEALVRALPKLELEPELTLALFLTSEILGQIFFSWNEEKVRRWLIIFLSHLCV